MSDNVYWLWLSLNCSAEAGNLLLDTFSSPYEVFKASEDEIASALNNRYPRVVKALAKKDLEEAKQLMDYCFLHDIGIMSLGDAAYPPMLRQIDAPPIVLYYRGKKIRFDKELLITVVGTRKITKYGEDSAFKFSYDLTRAGAIIVSGLAVGVDGVAAAGALAAGGRTIAVLGSGLERIYPANHKKLFANILKNGGMVVSEYPPYSAPEKRHFPQRNRIISGISLATLLIEGDKVSGALITAKEAMHQGRRVFAVPGKIDEPTSFCSNWLIQNGAKAVTAVEDILDCFAETHKSKIRYDRLIPKTDIDQSAVIRLLEVELNGVSGGTYGPRSQRKRREKPSDAPSRPSVSEKTLDTVVLPPSMCPYPEADAIPFGENMKEEGQRVLQDFLMRKDSDIKRERTVAEAAKPSILSPGADKKTEDLLARLPMETVVVYRCVTEAPQTVDQIMIASRFPLSEVITSLVKLEMYKLVVSLPGSRYKRATKE